MRKDLDYLNPCALKSFLISTNSFESWNNLMLKAFQWDLLVYILPTSFISIISWLENFLEGIISTQRNFIENCDFLKTWIYLKWKADLINSNETNNTKLYIVYLQNHFKHSKSFPQTRKNFPLQFWQEGSNTMHVWLSSLGAKGMEAKVKKFN